MPKGIIIAVVTGIIAVTGAVIVIFDDAPKGPDSGDEIDLSQEPTSPDSGDEIDVGSEPTSPDSGDEIDMNPDVDEDDDDGEPQPTSPDSGDEAEPGPDSGDEIRADSVAGILVKGSCNAITMGSTCIEYLGSYWTSTTAKMNCSGVGFSTGPCPRPALGGCVMGSGTPNEIVSWHYAYGGDPYTEVISYAAQSCRALPGGMWIQ